MKNYKVVNVIAPQVIKDDASWTESNIDTLGFSSVNVLFSLGASDIAMAALKLQESDDASTWTDITGLVYGTSTNIAGSTSALPSADDYNKVYEFSIRNMTGRKRYIQIVATAGNGSAGTYGSCIALLGNADTITLNAAGLGLGDCLAI